MHTHIGAYHILHGVDLTVPAGQVTMLLGRNGAGKTTTLRTIMGLWKASQGNVRFDGEAAGGPGVRVSPPDMALRGVAYVPENMGIFADLSVKENILLAARAPPTPASSTRRGWNGSSGSSPRCASSGCIRPASFPAGRSRCWRSRAPSSNRAGCC